MLLNATKTSMIEKVGSLYHNDHDLHFNIHFSLNTWLSSISIIGPSGGMYVGVSTDGVDHGMAGP